MRILADATLPNIRSEFHLPFKLTLYQNNDQVESLLVDHDILLCRSTLKVSAQLLDKTQIKCVATASSGIDHIDVKYLKNHNIKLIDAKGSNARSVADYVMSSLAFLQTKNLLKGHLAGVIGVGEVGLRVVARLRTAGFDVVCFDPLKASLDPNFISCEWNELLKCDLLCIHSNLHEVIPFSSKNLIDDDILKHLKPGVVILNASRGGIVNENSLLREKKKIVYCTDVYYGEPSISRDLIDFSTLCTPHIAGHSLEAKNAALLQVRDAIYNYYNVDLPNRICEHLSLIKTNVFSCWQDNFLNIYNPIKDTITLKNAFDKKQSFLTQRNDHLRRHNYNLYDWILADDLTRQLLIL